MIRELLEKPMDLRVELVDTIEQRGVKYWLVAYGAEPLLPLRPRGTGG